LRLLAAAMLAGGMHEDEALFTWLAQQKPMLEERTMAALMLALGAQRVRPMPDFWPRMLGGQKSPEMILAIAARLASVRFPEAAAAVPLLTTDDPGLVAAAAFAGGVLPASSSARWWNVQARVDHADLVWRGVLLGAARDVHRLVDPALLTRAGEVMNLGGDPMAAARSAAVWLRSSAHDLREQGQPLDVSLLQIATGDLQTAALLRGWLGPTAQPRDQTPQRLAVAYALTHPTEDVLAERVQWATDGKIAAPIALALAFRLAGHVKVEPVNLQVPGLVEWQFVRAASGATVDPAMTVNDPALAALLPLYAEGRVPRAALRRALEECLWRLGHHPRLAPFELERTLVRDLLLAGSDPGGKYLLRLRQEQRYAPTGMDRDDPFYAVAVALYDFLAKPRGPMPAEHRLQ
jgi:hypothetical protein